MKRKFDVKFTLVLLVSSVLCLTSCAFLDRPPAGGPSFDEYVNTSIREVASSVKIEGFESTIYKTEYGVYSEYFNSSWESECMGGLVSIELQRKCPWQPAAARFDSGLYSAQGSNLSPRELCDRGLVTFSQLPVDSGKAEANSTEAEGDKCVQFIENFTKKVHLSGEPGYGYLVAYGTDKTNNNVTWFVTVSSGLADGTLILSGSSGTPTRLPLYKQPTKQYLDRVTVTVVKIDPSKGTVEDYIQRRGWGT